MVAEAKKQRKWKRFIEKTRGLAFLFLILSCSSSDNFVSQSTTDSFAQNYNPPFADFLWVIDNRSPMTSRAAQLTSDAADLFARLDASADQYRMAFVTMDMEFAQGQLQPLANPQVLTRNLGTLDERTQNFRAIFASSLNLTTGPDARGFEAASIALKKYFVPQPKVPMYLIFVSDSEDTSTTPAGTDPLTYYSGIFLSAVGGNADLIKAYAVDLEPLPTPTTPKTSQNRCTTLGNADIDKPGYQGWFFQMAAKLKGSTADLCGHFADQIDLTGIKLKQLPTAFTLTAVPQPETIQVSVFYANQSEVTGTNWTYDSSANQVVFDTAPPEGTNIEVTYQTAGK